MAVDGGCATCHLTSVQAATDTTSQCPRQLTPTRPQICHPRPKARRTRSTSSRRCGCGKYTNVARLMCVFRQGFSKVRDFSTENPNPTPLGGIVKVFFRKTLTQRRHADFLGICAAVTPLRPVGSSAQWPYTPRRRGQLVVSGSDEGRAVTHAACLQGRGGLRPVSASPKDPFLRRRRAWASISL